VLGDRIIDTRSEWRTFANDDGDVCLWIFFAVLIWWGWFLVGWMYSACHPCVFPFVIWENLSLTWKFFFFSSSSFCHSRFFSHLFSPDLLLQSSLTYRILLVLVRQPILS
jgi:hypothetical protein